MGAEKAKSTITTEIEAEVLYQRLGSKWYAFSLIDDEVFVGSIDDAAVTGLDQTKTEPSAQLKNKSTSIVEIKNLIERTKKLIEQKPEIAAKILTEWVSLPPLKAENKKSEKIF